MRRCYNVMVHHSSPYPFCDQFVFQSSVVWIGEFRCHHTHDGFTGRFLFQGHHNIVFPRTTVELKMIGRESLIGSPNIAIFYNYDTLFERQKLTEDGDCCDYFQFSPSLLDEILRAYHPHYNVGQPFSFTHALVSRENFLRQREIVREIGRNPQSDFLQIDELSVALLESLVADSFLQYGFRPNRSTKTQRIHRQLAFDAEKLLTTHYAASFTLRQLAAMLHTSPYHLSRVFRQQTGCTLHHFREQLRLRIAYERLGDYAKNITYLALEVGYTTHSHFTEAFHRAFGVPPSQITI